MVACGGRASAGRADRQADAAVRSLRHHGGRRRHHSARLVRRLVSRRSHHGRGGRMPASSRLSRARGAPGSADAEPGLGPEPDRHLLQPGLRLRRRRISDRRDERLRPRLGRDPAAALVSRGPVRSGCARRPACGFGQAVHGSGRTRLRLFFPGLAAAPRHRPYAEPAPGALDSARAIRAGSRRRLSQRGDSHPLRSIRAQPDRARADPLWRPLSAALSRRGSPEPSDCGGRPGPHRAQPGFCPGPQRRPVARRHGPGEYAGGRAEGAGQA